MDDLYKTPTANGGKVSDTDDVTVFQTPSKALIDGHRHQWARPTSPSKGLPSSHRDNVVDALKNIQDRIRTLEVERTTAEDNLKGLSKETNYYRRSLEKMRAESARTTPQSGSGGGISSVSSPTSPQHVSTSHHHGDMQQQLQAADSRCELLDKQLEYMRKMLNEAEAEKRLAYERSEQMLRLRSATTGQEMRSQMEKISDMEREYNRLKANQAVAQERIKDLERVLEETRQMNMHAAPANLSAELRSAAKTNQILIDKLSPPASPHKLTDTKAPRRKKKARKYVPVQAKPAQHYRFNMADIPFVVGQATGPSHRVGSNVQNVIAKLKTHNPALCAAVGEVRGRPHSASPRRPKRKSGVRCSARQEGDLQGMTDQLAEEYTHMSAEHHELTRELDAATKPSLSAAIQRELDQLELRMSVKAEQIAKLSAYQSKLREKDDSSNCQSVESREAAANKGTRSSISGEVEVTTTIKTRGQRAGRIEDCAKANVNLATLKNMRRLKTRLKPDELHWST